MIRALDFGDFGFAASFGNGEKGELGGYYKKDNLEVRVAVWDTNNSTDKSRTGAAISATWLMESGFNLTGAYSGDNRDNGSADDPRNIYVKLGYKTGNNSFGIDWSETKDLGPGDGTSASVAWVNQPMAGIELYAMYRVESVDDVSGDDIDAVLGGARIKF